VTSPVDMGTMDADTLGEAAEGAQIHDIGDDGALRRCLNGERERPCHCWPWGRGRSTTLLPTHWEREGLRGR